MLMLAALGALVAPAGVETVQAFLPVGTCYPVGYTLPPAVTVNPDCLDAHIGNTLP
ncbi:MAG TPA: hypothetical protein VHI93_02045 [Candidatus Thermoplasmatota archaeon]|nr:hypothetical protein [Candidatus Thermoplasmatota archaeon]